MSVLEKSIEDYLIRQVAKAGGMQIKIASVAHWPDRLIIMPFVGLRLVELKRPNNGRLSGGQKMLHDQLLALGIHVHVIWTKADVDNFINEHKVL